MSEVRASPPPAVGEEQVRPVSQQPSTSSARMQQEPPPLLDVSDEGSPDSVSSSFEVDILSAMGEEQVRPVSQQPSTSSARMQQEPPPLLDVGDEGSPDSVSSSFDPEIMSFSPGAARSRIWSPQPSASPAKMQLKLQPFVKAGEAKWTDQVSSRGGVNSSSRSSWVNRTSRPWSPQPSTSSAGMLMERELQPFFDPLDMTREHMYAQDLSIRRPPAGSWEARASSPQPSTSSAGMHFDLKRSGKARDVKPADSTDSDYSLNPRNNSTPWPWSPTPSTSSAAMMLELELVPVDEGASGSIYSRVARNVSAPLGGERLRPWSPQPTTSSESPLNQSELPVVSLTDDVTGETLPIRQSIDYSEIGRDISVNKRLRRWSTSKLRPTITAEATSTDSDYQNTSATPIMGTLRRWPPQRLISPTTAERAQLEMKTFTEAEADGATSEDSDHSWVAQNLSVPCSERKKRPLSPQPSTSRAALMQLKLMPLMEAIDSQADSFSMSVVQNISALVEEKKRHQRSPQASTSSVPLQLVKARDEKPAEADSSSAAQNSSVPVGEGVAPPAPQPSSSAAATLSIERAPAKEPVQKNPANSVYAHVPHNISNIPQLRGLKAGRRHGRLRRLYTQNKIQEKYGPMIQYFGPMVAEESAKQQTQHILIASALDHFANTINQIADKYEGKVDTGFAERLEEFRKRMEERRVKRRKRNPNATEEPLPRSPSPPMLSAKEINRRLREETEAAVEALLTGDRSKESPPDRFAEIIKSFQDAYNPK